MKKVSTPLYTIFYSILVLCTTLIAGCVPDGIDASTPCGNKCFPNFSSVCTDPSANLCCPSSVYHNCGGQCCAGSCDRHYEYPRRFVYQCVYDDAQCQVIGAIGVCNSACISGKYSCNSGCCYLNPQ